MATIYDSWSNVNLTKKEVIDNILTWFKNPIEEDAQRAMEEAFRVGWLRGEKYGKEEIIADYESGRRRVKEKTKKLTVQQLIQQEIDIDVYDDVCEELAIAFCGPVELAEEGKKKFAEVLGYECELRNDVCVVNVDDEDGKWQKKLKKAKRFFEAAAGYCPKTDYNEWFKTEEEQK